MPPAGPVGFTLPGRLPIPATEALALLERAADAGADPLLATELNGFDAFAMAAATAVRRPGIGVGTGVVPFGARTAASLGMAATTIAAISAATFHLGVGVSSPAVVEGWHGGVHDPSLDRTRQRLRAIRDVLAGARRGSFSLAVDHAGGQVRVLIGAMGPRMRELAFQEADGVVVNHSPPRVLEPPPPDRTQLVYIWVRATQAAEARARRELVSYASTAAYGRHFGRLGFGADVEMVDRARAEGRLRDAPDQLSSQLVDDLYVTPARLGERMAAVRRVGGVPVVVPVTGDDPRTDVRRTVDALALEALPDEGVAPGR